LLTTRARDLDASSAGHVQVAHDEVGLVLADGFDRLFGRAGFADDPEAVAQVGAHAVAPDRMVVGQHHLHQGSHRRTSVPRPGALSISTEPSRSAILPRIDRVSPTPSLTAEVSKPEPSSLTEQNTPPWPAGSAYTVTRLALPCLPAFVNASPTAPASARTSSS